MAPVQTGFGYLLLCCLFISATALSQISSEGVDRHFITNARAAGLADAIVADASDASNMYWNPSSLAFLRDRSVVVNYSLERVRGWDSFMNENIAVSLLHDNTVALGLGATHSHVGHIEAGSPLTGYSFNQWSLDLAAAITLWRFLSIGVMTTFRYGQTGSQNSAVGSASLGIMYYPSPEISYGLTYQGIGDGIEYAFDTTETSTNPVKTTLSRSLELGATLRFDARGDHPSAVFTIAAQRIFEQKTSIYKGGLEVWPVDFLALRIGYWIGTQTVAGRYGGGVRAGQWQFDYGVSTTKLEPMFHQASLLYYF